MWVPGSLAFLLPVLWIVATVMVTREPDRMGTAPSHGCQSVGDRSGLSTGLRHAGFDSRRDASNESFASTIS
jgi:hypothetical protein